MNKVERRQNIIFTKKFISKATTFVIPAKAGIQAEKELDARLRTSGMTEKLIGFTYDLI